MKQQLLMIGIIVIIVTVWLSGCNQVSNTMTPEKTRFIGTWQNTTRNITRTIILFSNDSCSVSILNETGTWDVQDSKLVMKFPVRQITYTFYYAFSNNDRNLSLTSAVSTSTTTVFTKQ